jgi:hypothetical protein
MPGFVHFLCCLGRAAVKNGGKALASLVPGGEAAFEIARDALEEYRKDHAEAQLRAELEGLAQAPPAEVRQAVAQVASEQPAEVCQALTAYLGQVPSSIRQALRPGGDDRPRRRFAEQARGPAELPARRPAPLQAGGPPPGG